MKAHDYDMRGVVCCLRAVRPEDQWVSLDAGPTEGWFITRPCGTPSRLLVNADAAGEPLTLVTAGQLTLATH